MLLRLLSKPWPIGITSLAVFVKEKSFDSAAPEKKEDIISFFTKTRICNSY
jgi:hypothetical protein